MEMRVLERDKNALKVSIETPDDTVVYPLINELLKDEDVAEIAINHVLSQDG